MLRHGKLALIIKGVSPQVNTTHSTVLQVLADDIFAPRWFYHDARQFFILYAMPIESSRKISFFNAQAMQIFAQKFAAELQAGDVLWLRGELGAGKTTFVQGLARGLQIEAPITSPTFVLIVEHHTGRLPLLHLDAYRLEDLDGDDEALRDAGIEDFLSRDAAIRVIEWPQCIGKYLQQWPHPRWQIDIAHDEQNSDLRHLIITSL